MQVSRWFNGQAAGSVALYYMHARPHRGDDPHHLVSTCGDWHSLAIVLTHPAFAMLAWYSSSTLARYDGDHAIGSLVMMMLVPPEMLNV